MNKTTITVTTSPVRTGDFLAVCLLLSHYPKITKVVRGLGPSGSITVGFTGPGDIADTDTGMRFMAVGSHMPGSALGLVLQHMGLYSLASVVWPWLHPLEIKETYGVFSMAEHLGCGADAINRSTLPLDQLLLEEFAKHGILDEGFSMFQQMILFGDALVRQLQDAAMVDKWVAVNHEILTVDGQKVLWIPIDPPWPIEQSINRFVMQNKKDVVASVIPDTKGPGWTFFRFRYHHNALDFRYVRESQVLFVNHDGSLLKTKERFNDESLIRRIIHAAKCSKQNK